MLRPMMLRHGDEQKGSETVETRKVRSCARAAPRRTDDVGGHGGAGEQQAGKVEDGVDPVGPAGDETVKGAEGLADQT
jgi:hypothetical protein